MSEADASFAGQVLGKDVFTLGEGATYDAATDTAWWFDILGCKLAKYRFATGETKIFDLPMMASALAFLEDGRQVVVNEDGLCIRDAKTGMLARYLDIESDDPATRSNDARVHPCGALWTSTMGKKAEDGAGRIYHVLKGKRTVIVPAISIPNAICFSADGATGYYADTREGSIQRIALDPATGLPSGEPTVFVPAGRYGGAPDGAVVDADGCLWSARWGVGCVDCYAPDGERIRSLALPVSQVTCPAFVGEKADRLLVTSAHEGMDAAARAAEPRAGATFLLDAPVNGRHEPRMIL